MTYKIVKLDDITVGKRFREDYEKIEELAEDIKHNGLINPLTVNQDMILLAGGRRYAALQHLGIDQCSICIKQTTPLQDREIELSENIQREDLTPAERIDLVREIHELKGEMAKERQQTDSTVDNWTMRQTAEALGESLGNVSDAIQLSKMVEMFPELRKCKTVSEIKKKTKDLIEKAATKQILKRAEVRQSEHFKFAENHYQIADTIEALRNLSQTVVSFVECDPPYGIDLNKVKKGDVYTDKNVNYDEIPADLYEDFISTVAKELYRTTADHCWMVWWFGIQWYEVVQRVLKDAGWSIDPIPAIWAKGSGQTNQPEIYLARTYETFFIARKGRPVLAKRGRSNEFIHRPIASSSKIHPTEKPLNLMIEILNTFVYPGSVIMCPFLGSGVTLRAAYACGLTGFGWDVSDRYKDQFVGNVLKDKENGLYDKKEKLNENG